VASTEKYYAPNGLRIVKLTTHRFEQHHPGEVAGFSDEVADALVGKGFAENHTPDAATVAKHEEEKAKKKAASQTSAPTPTKKDEKPAAK
jgi:hypothetical protein